jgi:hypothetical protein
MKATKELYEALNNAYSYFNKGLFKGELPEVVLTLRRARMAKGMAASSIWKKSNGKVNKYFHEISISPYWLLEPLIKVYSTLVHEQCHIWQFEYGKPGKYGYHNLQWARKMEEVGLTPSTTGKEGGKKTGYSLSHYVTPSGKYEELFKTLPKKCYLPSVSIEGNYKPDNRRNKVKYHCCNCNYSVWGKQDLSLICGCCKNHLIQPE